MTDAELYMNPDHTVWAREFCRVARKIGFDPTNPEHEFVGRQLDRQRDDARR